MWRECAAVGHRGLCASRQLCLFSGASLNYGSMQPLLLRVRWWRNVSFPLGKMVTSPSVPAMKSVAKGATRPAMFAGI